MLPDTIGRIEVPEIAASGTFPLVGDFPHDFINEPEVIVHQFGSANAKIEQRFYKGPGLCRYTVRRRSLSPGKRTELVNFWEARKGAYQPFTYDAPGDGPAEPTAAITARFMDPALTIDHVSALITSVGLTLVEVPTVFPTYAVSTTLERFPDAGLETALLGQVQTLIPLVKIRVTEAAVPDIFLSDRRVTVDGQLYLARLLDWGPITQGLGGESDAGPFVFGNADRVMTHLAGDTDLNLARIEFSLFHVDTLTKIDIWAGEVQEFGGNGPLEYHISASDPISYLSLTWPPRKIDRQCWKAFDDGNACPAAGSGGSNLEELCDKGFDTEKGCVFHTMEDFHGGIHAQPQLVNIKDNSKGFFGFGRPTITAAALLNDSVYGEVLPQVYCNGSEIPVKCKIIAGRDESDFYTALGVVCEGPIGAFADPVFPGGMEPADPKHRLDTQPWHGFKDGNLLGFEFGSPPLGPSLGPDPNDQPFELDYTGPRRAAGVAFMQIRRVDEPGIQLSRLSEHEMTATVSEGLSGWVWTGPGSRSEEPLTNPIWVLVNMFLRSIGLQFASAGEQENYLDIEACVAAADICDEEVDKIVGEGTAPQFEFIGVIDQQKPLREWMQEVLNNCLGEFTFRFGKLRPIIRVNSSTAEAFTVGNMLWNSLNARSIRPEFNSLRYYFNDEASQFATRPASLFDEDHAKMVGKGGQPFKYGNEMNLAGTASADQATRLVISRLREELGGINSDQWKRRREFSFRTTVLALAVDPGMVISVTDGEFSSAAGESNVGNGVLGTVEFSGPAAQGNFRVVIVAESPGAGDFEVYGPDDELIGTGTVGVEFEGGGLRFTLGAGGTDFAIDDEFTITMSPQEMPGGTGEGRVRAWRLNSDYSIDINAVTTVDEMYDYTVGPKPDDVEPDPVPEEVDVAPPAPSVGIAVAFDGYVRFQSIVFPSYEGATRQVTSIRWAVFHVDELALHLTTLAENIDGSQTTFDLDDASGLVGGNWIEIIGEIMFLTEDPTGNTITVLRGEKGSIAGGHSSGEKVWLVKLSHRFNYFPTGTWTGLPGSGGENFVAVHEFRSQKIVAYEWIAYNSRGGSPQTFQNTSTLFGTGLRMLAGIEVPIWVNGDQSGEADNIAPPGAWLTFNVSIGSIVARIETPPSGGDLTYRINVNGDEIGTVTIEDGETESNTLNGIDTATGDILRIWQAGQILTVDRTDGSGGGSDVVILVKV